MTEGDYDPFAPPEQDSARPPTPSPSIGETSPSHVETLGDTAATWQRTSALQVIVAPARALANLALPLIVVLVVGSGGSGRGIVGTLSFALPVATLVMLGSLLPWLGTRWRIADGRLQQKYRVLSTKQTSVTLDRVRSVDLESSLWHRALGLSVVKIGTGVDDERITLDSLVKSEALELQEFLLRRGFSAWSDEVRAGGDAAASEASKAEPALLEREVLARLDWSWLRFAPLQISQLVVLAAAFGFLAQFADDLPIDQRDIVTALRGQVDRLGLLLVVGIVVVVLGIGYVIAAGTAYAVRWYGLIVSRDAENLRVEAGLLTTRSVTVEHRRIRGLEVLEPALVRWAGGAQLSALATGVGSGGTTQVLPSCPRHVTVEVGEQVLAATDALTVDLVKHGGVARRRRHIRAQLPAVPGAATLVILAGVGALPVSLGVLGALLVPVAAGLGELSYRHLGHSLTEEHLVAGSGLLGRRREVLQRSGVIGWKVTQTWFQRRVGLCTLVAATAAGREQVSIVDVRSDVAVALARRVTPGLVGAFADDAGRG